ncbi:LysR family transcriptional regulator [Photobacterium sanctipauli]|uniref:LysR family transcriptional regulator n=1 Tax=Photobacterium sanctipauli TaxID=1342794 RepID=A0A2T3NPM5_9GAMM|nr:LysR family transcriptional regulator [Photobacterium sanctipauli]PSW18201.1 LysR family transcriptional regulator [Photobacterium sanctipauli]
MKLNLDDISLFIQTVEHGGISAAAAANNLQRSKISRRLQELESALGCQLLIRTTRTIELTDKGKQLYDMASQPIELLQQGLKVFCEQQSNFAGTIRVAIPTAIMTLSAFNEVITEYTKRFPNIRVEIENHQESVDLKRQAFDLQLLPSVVKVSDDSYIQFSLLSYRSHLVASKAYLSQFPPIASLADLKAHRLLTNRYNAGLLPSELHISVQSDDLTLLRTMAIAGSGIAFIPEAHSRKAMEDGQLVEVLPPFEYPDHSLTLVYPSSVYLPEKVKVLIELFRQNF